ncbi:molybdate ABC transporter substrate-binding protein [Tropicimonas sp. S265A]|uniref:molybdate ABC transporter substrate-binding protein n=1 Tax=Tropicimonas sp. S265A TaxID=3415134 RepID=UPI003C7DB8BF
MTRFARYLTGAVASWLSMLSLALADPVVLAAASTNRALDAALAASGIKAVTSYGASGVLARQIEQGAPADLFVSANPKWMTYLVDAGLIDAEAVRVLMSNSLVLIAPEGDTGWAGLSLDARLDDEFFAMADPATAPVGAYGRAALEAQDLWSSIAPHHVPTRNTLATVAAVSKGEAALGLVYASDATGQAVQVIRDIPTDSHPPIRYLIAPVAQGSDATAATALLAFLDSDAGRAILSRNGFLVETGP